MWFKETYEFILRSICNESSLIKIDRQSDFVAPSLDGQVGTLHESWCRVWEICVSLNEYPISTEPDQQIIYHQAP